MSQIKLFIACFLFVLVGTIYAAEQVSEIIVDTHVGKNRSDSGTYVYNAPKGKTIIGYQINEHSKWGDASYSVQSSTETRIQVSWKVRSHEIKALGVTVDTKTARLSLSINVTLEAAAPSVETKPESAPVLDSKDELQPAAQNLALIEKINKPSQELVIESSQSHPTTFSEWFISVVYDTHWGVILMFLAIILGGLLAIWSTFPDSIKERIVLKLLRKQRIT